MAAQGVTESTLSRVLECCPQLRTIHLSRALFDQLQCRYGSQASAAPSVLCNRLAASALSIIPASF